MKKKLNDKVYLQKYDIAFITHFLRKFPASIVGDLFDSAEIFVMNGEDDSIRFSHHFSGEAAEWIMAQPWIIDFDEFYVKKVSDIKKIWSLEHVACQEYAENFNSQNPTFQAEHYEDVKEELDKRAHRLRSLSLMRLYLNGEVKLSVPGIKRKLFRR